MLKIDEIQAQSSVAQRGLNASDEKTAREEKSAIEHQVENRTIQAISNFPIPNTKEDLIEFMTLCLSNSEAENFTASKIGKAWQNKFEQLIAKARIIIPNNPIAEDLIEQYETKREISKEKNKNFLKWFLIAMAIMILIVIIINIFAN